MFAQVHFIHKYVRCASTWSAKAEWVTKNRSDTATFIKTTGLILM